MLLRMKTPFQLLPMSKVDWSLLYINEVPSTYTLAQLHDFSDITYYFFRYSFKAHGQKLQCLRLKLTNLLKYRKKCILIFSLLCVSPYLAKIPEY